MKLHARWLLSIALLPALPACAGDDDDDDTDDDAITWRVPCGSEGHWLEGPRFLARYTYDDNKRLLTSITHDDTGELVQQSTRTWSGSNVLTVDFVGRTLNYRIEYAYDDDGNPIRGTRTDRALDNGDQGYTIRWGYDAGGALVSSDLDFADPSSLDRHATITGNLTPTETWVDCLAGDPTSCDTQVYQQPDSDPEHWISGTDDWGSDGAIEYRMDRTLDGKGLELSSTSTAFSFDPAGVVEDRFTYDREPDGTVLGTTHELFNEDGTPADTYSVVNQFTCAAARFTPAAVARPSRDLDREPAGPLAMRRALPVTTP